MEHKTNEHYRLWQDRQGEVRWKQWGPYLTDRQWGTVREDYSPYGNAWEHVSHDMARSKAYRWGEEGIGGWSDDQQRLCVAWAFWNGRDPILKERLFGLTGNEGNHGEDVKELYYYLDATPTHSYMRMLYKYPQQAFPYEWLVQENRRRNREEREFELVDTGIFDADEYFDIFIEYIRPNDTDVVMRVHVHNRGPKTETLHLLPMCWFRNTWSWGYDTYRPLIYQDNSGRILAEHKDLGVLQWYARQEAPLLFCENETNQDRLYGIPNHSGSCKDAFHEFVVHGNSGALNAECAGTRFAMHYQLEIPGGATRVLDFRLGVPDNTNPFSGVDRICQQRKKEADEFFACILKNEAQTGYGKIQREALAGMIWSKQFYYFDVQQWLDGDPAQPAPPEQRHGGRNRDWRHLNNADILSMPDTWEYPWYAAWDLAFHCIPLARMDPEFAKQQLMLLTREWYMHPNGQLPAYEWAFGDVNPPVHAWATWKVYQIDREFNDGQGDTAFLESVFHKLLLNFTWWVNRKDAEGNNIFQGGFLGLDNIGIFDRSAPLPTGGYLEQADGTSWMAMFSLNLMRISLELARTNPVYQDMATKFFEHFLYIAGAMANMGEGDTGLWDNEDQFFYDVLRLPDDRRMKLRIRSMVGLIPLFAVEVLEHELLEALPDFKRRLNWFLTHRPHLAELVSRWNEPGQGSIHLLSLLRGHRMKKILERMLDPNEFLSDYGIRALSKVHEAQPFSIRLNGHQFQVNYTPGESTTGVFGGNSNWRGPIWMPVNYLIIESLRRFHQYYGSQYKVECPVGSGRHLTLEEVALEISARLGALFQPDPDGRRPCLGDHSIFHQNPEFRDHILFYEYFHGDTGRGIGASHQTGWTGLIADLLLHLNAAEAVKTVEQNKQEHAYQNQ